MINKIGLYSSHLFQINHIFFTEREIDVISCILHAKQYQKIAVILSISIRTVQAHVSNILTKISAPSREYIVEFVETSGKLDYIRQYYNYLLLDCSFEKALANISSRYIKQPIEYNCNIINSNDLSYDIKKILRKHLNIANVIMSNRTDSKNILDFNLILDGACYYIFVFELIAGIVKINNFNDVVKKFESERKRIENKALANSKSGDHVEVNRKNIFLIIKYFFYSFFFCFSF